MLPRHSNAAWIGSAAPLLTVVPPAAVPRPVALLMFKTPALIRVAPASVFAPLSANVPGPLWSARRRDHAEMLMSVALRRQQS